MDADPIVYVSFAGLAGGFLAALVVLWRHDRRIDQHNASLKKVAEACGGRLEGAEPGLRGRIELCVDGVIGEVRTEHAGDDGTPRSCVHFHWRPSGTLHLAAEGLLARIGKLLGGQDIQIGEFDFDMSYLVRGQPEGWVRQVLDAPTRGRIGSFAVRCKRAIQVDAGTAGVRIEVPIDLAERGGDLRELIDTSIAILRRCREVSQGLDALPAAEEVVAAGRCPVCAQPLAEPLRRCPRCRTAHHRECWEYFGTCAIYGCAKGRPTIPAGERK